VNCTVVQNATAEWFGRGGGVYESSFSGQYYSKVANSIIYGNQAFQPFNSDIIPPTPTAFPTNSCIGAMPLFLPNWKNNSINANPQLVDDFHLSITSPCRNAGLPTADSAVDLDGDPLPVLPSMGCDEVVPENLVGPLSIHLTAWKTNLVVNKPIGFVAKIGGLAAGVVWSFSDGTPPLPAGAMQSHQWASPGDFVVTATAYNTEYPQGVTTNLAVHVDPLFSPLLSEVTASTNYLAFRFQGQADATYVTQYATNLTAPIVWNTLQTFYFSTGQVHEIRDVSITNGARFYRVLAQ
jgi:hypothetical protein